MTFCGTLPGLLSAKQERKRAEKESVMHKQDIFVSFLKPQSAEMLHLLSGSSLHNQFLWPQNCTCLLITGPGGGETKYMSKSKSFKELCSKLIFIPEKHRSN